MVVGLKDIARAAAAKHGTELLICFGGNSRTNGFPEMVADAGARQRFIATLTSFCREHGLDGVDYNWEYPKDGTECMFSHLGWHSPAHCSAPNPRRCSHTCVSNVCAQTASVTVASAALSRGSSNSCNRLLMGAFSFPFSTFLYFAFPFFCAGNSDVRWH